MAGWDVVFKARHKRLNRIVALKTIRTGVLRPTEETFRRLRFEAEVVASLDHPNIVPIYEIGEHRGCPYLVLKLIPCGDLEHMSRDFARTREPRHACWRGSPGRSTMLTCAESFTAT